MSYQIIFLTRYVDNMGGVVRVITNWSNFLCSKGFDIKILCSGRPKSYYFLNQHVKIQKQLFFFGYKLFSLFNIPINTILLYITISKQPKSILIFNKSNFIEIVFILKIFKLLKNHKFIYFHHGSSSSFNAFFNKSLFTRHRKKMIKYSFDEIITIYNDSNEVNSFINILNPFDLKENVKIEKKNIVLYVGRISYSKGVDQLLKAWNDINELDWELHLVGETIDEEILHLIKKNNVKIFDKTPDVYDFYNESKIFVSPSKYEGFGYTILEAMYFNNLVISSKTDGGKFLIKNKINGFLYDSGDLEKLKNLISKSILEYDTFKSIINNAKKGTENFSAENNYKSWLKILD